MSFLFIAALLLNDLVPHENMTPGIQGGVYFFDYLPSDESLPGNGLFIRASLGYLGEETEPIQIPRIPYVLSPPAPWPGPWPGHTNTPPRVPGPGFHIPGLPVPPTVPWWAPPASPGMPDCDPDPVDTPEPEPGILLGAGLFVFFLGKEMRRTYRYE
jgi:hypothetical protein